MVNIDLKIIIIYIEGKVVIWFLGNIMKLFELYLKLFFDFKNLCIFR